MTGPGGNVRIRKWPASGQAPAKSSGNLDHAALWEDLLDPSYDPRKEKTGTPSWISPELASDDPRSFPAGVVKRARVLLKRFQDNQDHPWFRAAFPSCAAEDVCFLANFEKVLVMEAARTNVDSDDYDDTVKTNPATAHLPRHDCESFYWILLYHLARAYAQDPKAPSVSVPPLPTANKAQKALDAFATAMLDHDVSEEDLRIPYVLGFDKQSRVLDAPLQGCVPLLEAMAAYLCIPWHRYEKGPNDTKGKGFVELNHVHHAFRRLILLEIMEMTKTPTTIPNVRFSTAGPRRLRPKEFKDRKKGTGSQAARGSGISSGKRSRTHEDDSPEDLDNLKRLKTNEALALGIGASRFPGVLEEGVDQEDEQSFDEPDGGSDGEVASTGSSSSFDEDEHDDSGDYEPPRSIKNSKKKNDDPFLATGLTASEADEDSVCSWIQHFERDELWFTTGVPDSSEE
ncbi:hypothetical protein EXIGLDRAFT_835101 [Exidia glandulosa HHB12029]|uniref:Uncharacterized protein n=1 Tax=Exidia glandulosa HHB12029 TaxID=1314781 RepID=A0A165J285_EXIGL|nr:hypothetical protein EXIGLDRAFT_835101 [Exidia glandulosa HHB12029]